MEALAQARATDASSTIVSLLGALLDQPRILAECAGYADCSHLAAQTLAKAVAAQVLADELKAAAAAMLGTTEMRRAA